MDRFPVHLQLHLIVVTAVLSRIFQKHPDPVGRLLFGDQPRTDLPFLYHEIRICITDPQIGSRLRFQTSVEFIHLHAFRDPVDTAAFYLQFVFRHAQQPAMHLLILLPRLHDTAVPECQVRNPLPLHRAVGHRRKFRLVVETRQFAACGLHDPHILQLIIFRKHLCHRQQVAALYIHLHLPQDMFCESRRIIPVRRLTAAALRIGLPCLFIYPEQKNGRLPDGRFSVQIRQHQPVRRIPVFFQKRMIRLIAFPVIGQSHLFRADKRHDLHILSVGQVCSLCGLLPEKGKVNIRSLQRLQQDDGILRRDLLPLRRFFDRCFSAEPDTDQKQQAEKDQGQLGKHLRIIFYFHSDNPSPPFQIQQKQPHKATAFSSVSPKMPNPVF